MWSKKYERCRECGTTERKHNGKGLCCNCYSNKKYRENPEPQKTRSNNYYAHHSEEKKEWQREYYNLTKEERLAYMRVMREEKHFGGKREAVLLRDGFSCTKCGSKELLIVHHIDLNGRGSSSPNNEMGNLATLCRACHVRVHLPRLGAGR